MRFLYAFDLLFFPQIKASGLRPETTKKWCIRTSDNNDVSTRARPRDFFWGKSKYKLGDQSVAVGCNQHQFEP